MYRDAGHTRSLWIDDTGLLEHPPLDADADAAICIVGAGIVGLTTAHLLAREGMQVLVLDDGPIGGGESGRTSAHLASAMDDRHSHLERLHGADGVRQVVESHQAAIDRIERIVREEGIACDFARVDGYLVLAPDDDESFLEEELDAARRAGHSGAVRVDGSDMPGLRGRPAIRFPNQGIFHPMRYLAGLSHAIIARGGRIATGSGTRVESIEAGEPNEVRTASGHTVRARHVVVATNAPISDMVVTHVKQAPYRTYIVGMRIPRGAVQNALYWDTLDPYHYVRLQPSHRSEAHDILIVGGEDHKTGQKDDGAERFAALEKWTREWFPMAESVEYRWSGQVVEPIDGLAQIGRQPGEEGSLYLATGDSGQGLTHGTIAGMLLTETIIGRASRWASLYDPARVTLRATGEFAKENLNVAAQYRDWITPGDGTEDDIERESGAVLRHGAKKLAVYRDADGKLHRHSAVCPHMKCIVQWNSTERSWDCPCHGSRFDPLGRLLNGPSATNLEEVE